MAEKSRKSPTNRKPAHTTKNLPAAHRRRSPAITLRKATLTIEFANEGELRQRLAALLEMIDRPATRAVRAAAGATAAESCLTLFEAVDVVEEALEPKGFVPSEELSDTYLTSQERELFKARVVERVEARRCQIDANNVPADEGTIHSAVAAAVRDHAHR